MQLGDAVRGYLEYLQTVGRRAPATIRAYTRDLERFQQFAEEHQTSALAQVQPPLVERWMASMRNLSDASVRRALNSVSGLYRWATRFGHADANPLDRVERPKKKRRIEPCPAPEEIAAMLQATNGEAERAAFLAMATSGLRRAELLSLDWRDVDLPRRRMMIHGKGDKEREVLIFEDLLTALYALHAAEGMPPGGPVIRGRQGSRLQTSTLQRWLNKWLGEAGLRDGERNKYTLHSLRRYAAKRWLDSGLNIRQVQLLLGHEDLQTTILYLNYDLDEIQRDAGRVDFGLAAAGRVP